MSDAAALQATDRRAQGAPPSLPRLSVVLLEHVRVTGLALRAPASIAAALFALLTLWVVLQSASRDVNIDLNAWPTQLPGIMGALLPIAVWARDQRFGPSFLWTLPVDRRRHALTKVLAGWLWLMAGVALFVAWLLAVTFVTGGRTLPPETLNVLTGQLPAPSQLDAATLRAVRWIPGPLIWAVPFTAATVTYLLASAVALGFRQPLRWVIGTVLTYATTLFIAGASAQLVKTDWPADAPRRAMGVLVEARYGLDALLTARLETLGTSAILTTGERVMVWSAVPTLADWLAATVLWTVVGVLALWVAASRHRERRRA